LITLLGGLLACSAFGVRSSGAASDVPSKIAFDLTPLDEAGLAGPSDGQVRYRTRSGSSIPLPDSILAP
jgi:hypothetical protein